MTAWSERYPWHRHTAGESFFVPTLDLGRTTAEGLRVGQRLLGQDAGITARAGVYNGMLGVLFTVQPSRRRLHIVG